MTSIIAAAAVAAADIITKLSVRFDDSHILQHDGHRSVQLNVRTTWSIFFITHDLHEELRFRVSIVKNMIYFRLMTKGELKMDGS